MSKSELKRINVLKGLPMDAINNSFGQMADNLVAAIITAAAQPKPRVKISTLDYRQCTIDGCNDQCHRTAGGKLLNKCKAHSLLCRGKYLETANLKKAEHAAGRGARQKAMRAA